MSEQATYGFLKDKYYKIQQKGLIVIPEGADYKTSAIETQIMDSIDQAEVNIFRYNSDLITECNSERVAFMKQFLTEEKVKEIEEANRIVLEENGTKALQYSTTEGYNPLREWIANRMNSTLGTSFEISNIQITHGSQQGLDLLGKIFLNKGDVVLCESPTYLTAISAFKAYECKFIEVPTDNQGMIPEELEKILKTVKNVKLIYTIPSFALLQ